MMTLKTNRNLGGRVFDIANVGILTMLAVITLYPCYYVLIASVSDPVAIYKGNGLLLWPKNFALYSYLEVAKNSMLWVGYRNTIFYVVCGTFLSVMLTASAAFCASRRNLPGKNVIMFLIMLTMYFQGGLIPSYLVVKSLKLLDTPLAMILPGAMSTYNLIITLNYFRGIPDSMEEAAKVDGAGDFRIFWQIMLPLAMPVIAVISLYYAVGIWNNYFTALIYITDKRLYPLQMVLREILLQSDTAHASASQMVSTGDSAAYAANIRYATIVVSTIPILCVYPFVQRYFIKGVMIGAVKG